MASTPENRFTKDDLAVAEREINANSEFNAPTASSSSTTADYSKNGQLPRKFAVCFLVFE